MTAPSELKNGDGFWSLKK